MPVRRCFVIGCNNTYKKCNPGTRFFSIPGVITNQCEKTRKLSEERRKTWLKRINRNDFKDEDVEPHTTVCSRHFIIGAPAKLFEVNHPDWAPSVHMGYCLNLNHKAKALINSQLPSHARILKRKKNDENISTKNKMNVEMKENKIDNQDKVEGILLEHYYCRKVPSTDNHSDEKKESKVEIIDLASASENKKIKLSTDTKLNKNNKISSKVDVACMTSITSDYIDYLQDESNFLKKEIKNLSQKKGKVESNVFIYKPEDFNCSKLAEEIRVTKEELEMYKKDNMALRQEVIMMRNCISKLSLNEAALKIDDNKVKLYTGFPNFTFLKHFYDFFASDVKCKTLSTSLNKFEEFLVVIMRIRMNVCEKDLGYRFGVSQGTISRIFARWMPVMAQKLQRLPEKINFRKSVPICLGEIFGDQFVLDLEDSGKIGPVLENIQKLKDKLMSTPVVSKDE